MKNQTSLVVITILGGAALIAGAFAEDAGEWTAPARAAKKKNPIAADAASIAKGREVYVKECVSCHGTAGKGDGPQAKDLEKKPQDLMTAKVLGQSDGALFWKLTEGRKPMASYEKFSEGDRWAVINYLRSLKH